MPRVANAVLALLLLAPAGCGDDPNTEGLVVLAASSLTEAFTDLARDFERAHAGVRVQLRFDGSSALVRSLAQGAPGDVLATADEPSMASAGFAVTDPQPFASNRLVIAVPADSTRVGDITDLARSDVDVVVCAATVPCGRAAAEVLRRAGVSARIRSYEGNVRAVLTKVASGEADAGLVYATDVRTAAGEVRAIDVPVRAAVTTTCTIAVVSSSSRQARAAEFVALVRADREVLTGYGFGAP